MSWLDKYRAASFRNVPFYVRGHDATFGRRNAKHEFPGRDIPYNEDMGRKARGFNVEGYIIGEDYHLVRDKMITASEVRGPGQLVHPYFGTLEVVCDELRVSEVNTERRMCRITFRFSESGDQVFPTTAPDTGLLAETSKDEALETTKEVFVEEYDVASTTVAVLQNVKTATLKAVNKLESDRKYISSASEYKRQLINFKDRVAQLIYSPQEYADELQSLLTFGTYRDSSQEVTSEEDNARTQFEELILMTNFVPDVFISDNDPTHEVQNFIVYSCLAACCSLATVMTYDSVDDAESVRTLLNDKVNEVLFSPALRDELYVRFRDLITKVNTDIDERGTYLSRLIKFTPTEDVPVCNIAFRLYGNLDEYESIIKRNNIRHPGFVKGSVPVEVLINAE